MILSKYKQTAKYNEDILLPALRKSIEDVPLIRVIEEIEKIEECGSEIKTIQCLNCGTNHFVGFLRCRSKFCASCNAVKSVVWVMHLMSYIEQWIEQGNYAVLVNFTLKDTDILEDGLRQLQDAWRNMCNGKYKRSFRSYFDGGFKSLEVTTGENSGQWHPHMHTILLKRKFRKDEEFLKLAWMESVEKAGGKCLQKPHFVPLRPRDREHKESVVDYRLGLYKNLRESCKYITKFKWDEEKPDRIRELVVTLRGRRHYALWGVLSHLRKEIDNTDNIDSSDKLKDFVCQYCGCTRGRPNRLYKHIWADMIQREYKTSAPLSVATQEQVEAARAINYGRYEQYKTDKTKATQPAQQSIFNHFDTK